MQNKLDIFKSNYNLMLKTFFKDKGKHDCKIKAHLKGLEWEALVQSLNSQLTNPLTYSVNCNNEFATEYRSDLLFKTRATKICNIFERGSVSETIDEYETELWMTENYEFAVVKVFRVFVGENYTTEYRTLKGFIPYYNTFKCSFEEFINVIDKYIKTYYEMQTPICEI